ncbi:MAG: hypothetical protein BWK76_04935 [Desulfobulbaceae bacterium A2]|nr:MAG: hypothetical protein BWK76_04935 [Desulfobulbaceae bacterium A2]
MIQSGFLSPLASVPVAVYDRAVSLHSEPAHYIPQSGSGQTGATEHADQVELSAAGRDLAAANAATFPPNSGPAAEDPALQQQQTGPGTGADSDELTAEELRMVEELRARDREVRAHEAAHLANAGQYSSGGASFTYQQGPDGRRYAVGGEVGIDTSKEQDPEATIRKMQAVRRAALAPADPSATDRSVAASAAARQAEAQHELQAEKLQALDTGATAPSTSTADEAPAVAAATDVNSAASSRRRFEPMNRNGHSALSIIA